MIDLEEKYYDINSYRKVKNANRKRSTTITFSLYDYVEYICHSKKAIRVNDKTLDLEKVMLNIRLIKELNYLPNPVPRKKSEFKYFSICCWTTEKQYS